MLLKFLALWQKLMNDVSSLLGNVLGVSACDIGSIAAAYTASIGVGVSFKKNSD